MRNFIETGSINEKLSKSPGFFKQICVIAPEQKICKAINATGKLKSKFQKRKVFLTNIYTYIYIYIYM